MHPRGRGFAEEVLRAYVYQCAMCGFDGALGHYPVAIEAAHGAGPAGACGGGGARSTSGGLVEQFDDVHPEQRGLPVSLAEGPARLLVDGWPHQVYSLIAGRRRRSLYLGLRPGAEPFVMLGEAGDDPVPAQRPGGRRRGCR